MNKRFLILLVIAALTAGYANAQSSFAERDSYVGFKMGMNSANINVSGNSPNIRTKQGIQFGTLLETYFMESFGIQFSFLFTQQGFISDLNGKDFITKINYLQYPAHALYKVDIGEDAKILLHAGPYLGVGINGKQKYDGEKEKIKLGFDKKKDLYNGIDFGFGIGIGAQYKLFRVDVAYNFGITDIALSDGISMKNTGLAITLALVAPMVK